MGSWCCPVISSVSHFASFSFLIHSLISYTGQSGLFLFQSPFFKHFSCLSSQCFSSYIERDCERDEEQLIWRKQRTISSSSRTSGLCMHKHLYHSKPWIRYDISHSHALCLAPFFSLALFWKIKGRWIVHSFHEVFVVHMVLKHHLMRSKLKFNTHTHTLEYSLGNFQCQTGL